jgi:hypothetical protein
MVRFDRPAPPTLSPVPPQVAAAPAAPAPVKLDGEYKGSLRDNVVAGVAQIPLHISVHGSTISGYAAPHLGRGQLVCRANGTMGTDGDATIQIFCSTSGFTQVSINATGRFEAPPGTTDVTGHMRYITSQGGTGDLVLTR